MILKINWNHLNPFPFFRFLYWKKKSNINNNNLIQNTQYQAVKCVYIEGVYYIRLNENPHVKKKSISFITFYCSNMGRKKKNERKWHEIMENAVGESWNYMTSSNHPMIKTNRYFPCAEKYYLWFLWVVHFMTDG